jgi:hypothetical protein
MRVCEENTSTVHGPTRIPPYLVLPKGMEERPILQNEAEAVLHGYPYPTHRSVPGALFWGKRVHSGIGTHYKGAHPIS